MIPSGVYDVVSGVTQKVVEYIPTPSLPTTQGALAAVAADLIYKEISDLPTDLVKSRMKGVFWTVCSAVVGSTAGKVVIVAGAAFAIYTFFPWRKSSSPAPEIPLFGAPVKTTLPVVVPIASGPSGEVL